MSGGSRWFTHAAPKPSIVVMLADVMEWGEFQKLRRSRAKKKNKE